MKKSILILLIGFYTLGSIAQQLDITNDANCNLLVRVYESNTSGCSNNVLHSSHILNGPGAMVTGLTPTAGFDFVGARVYEACSGNPVFLFQIGDGGACQSYCTAPTTGSAAPSPCWVCDAATTTVDGVWTVANPCSTGTHDLYIN